MKPKIGDIIYLDTDLYVSSGWNDRRGGKARISCVTKENGKIWVQVEEFPESSYLWDYLEGMQERFKEEFGNQWAHRDPDDRPEFNEWP